MTRIKEYLKDLYRPVIVMTSLGLVITIIIHFLSIALFDYNVFLEKDGDKRLDGFLKILGVAISVTGFLSIILTIIESRKNIQREIQKNTVDLFREFRSEKLRKARNDGWEVKKKWFGQEDYKQKYLNHNFNNPTEIPNAELEIDTHAVYDLLEFYMVLSSSEITQDVLKTFRFFYYGWWRKFLYSIAEEIEKKRKMNLEVLKNSPAYVESLSFTNNLKKLDKLCGFEGIKPDEELHFDGG